ncbi:hypothetical protein TTRE_0000452601 [Trichuris trichiura]|uniref:Secreted protein n=1 Tax=Trichuris trichiura TaxID=36087 RepID=A0A077Z7R8_TRITR|nr:hypothetical protein TTRE_0000452601 [Trichuris trichiura]
MSATGNCMYVAIAFAATIHLCSAEENEFFKLLPFNNAFDSFKRLFNLQPTNTEQQVQTGKPILFFSFEIVHFSRRDALLSSIASFVAMPSNDRSNCSITATKTGFIWGSRLRELISSHDSYDLGKETCEQMAQSQACDQLSAHLAKCDVAGGIASFIGFVQARQRCKKLSNFFTNSDNVRKNVGGLLSNEFVGGLMQKFIG